SIYRADAGRSSIRRRMPTGRGTGSMFSWWARIGAVLTMSSSSNPYPVYSPTGHIVYVDGVGDSVAIWALLFSLTTLQPSGKAFPIAQRGSSPVVSRTGTLVYSDTPSNRLQLAWVDRSGR